MMRLKKLIFVNPKGGDYWSVSRIWKYQANEKLLARSRLYHLTQSVQNWNDGGVVRVLADSKLDCKQGPGSKAHV